MNTKQNDINNFLPASLTIFFVVTGDVTRFSIRFFKEAFSSPFELKEVIQQ
jgi:hypothetical protein